MEPTRRHRLWQGANIAPMDDSRPPAWIGHTVLNVTDLDVAATFWESLGVRPVEQSSHVAIFELRGGTHLILLPADEVAADAHDVPFDLMVDDLEVTHRDWSARGLEPSTITTGRIHSSFAVKDPDGRTLTVNSSHVVGAV